MKRYLRLLSGLALAGALLAQAPGPAPFSLRSQQGQNVQLLNDGGTITFSSEGVGQPVSTTVTFTYTGRATATINSLDAIGSTDFSVTLRDVATPFTMNPNDTATFLVQYSPTALGKVTGTARINYTEGRTTANVIINLVGVQPDFGFSVAILPKGNQTSISPDGGIAFPDTVVNPANPALNQTSSATFVITNRGSGQGTVNNIVGSGAQFNLSGVPLLPAVIQPSQTLTFTVNFAPTQLVSSSGTVRIDFVLRSVNFSLLGNGIGGVLAYEFVAGSTTRAVSPNDTLTLPQTNLGDKNTATFRVRNTGNADATVAAIASSDPLFALSNVPFLPLTLQAGNSATFTITFAPTQPGTFTARLRIDSASFNLSGVGLGVNLSYAATVGAASTTLLNNGTLIFPPTQVGATSSAQFQVSNTGNAVTFVNSISLTGPTGVFALTSLPGLPVRIEGGATISFGLVFAPNTLGVTTGTLRIDGQSFNLSGAGNDPPPLPAVAFSGATAATDAAQQIAVGVTLANPYPVPLVGKMLLTFAPAADVFSDDLSIQFASGGRSVNFVVPANTTRGVFGLSDSQVRLQTGTVAGTITLAALFVTDPGGINLTANAAPATNIAVRPSPPRVRSVQLGTRTATSFTILITGYAPTRSVNQMAFQFAPFVDPNDKDLKLDTTSLNLSVDGSFNAWYQSTASQAFGSLFTATVTFNVRGNVDAIQSVAVTLGNALGTSNSVSVNLR